MEKKMTFDDFMLHKSLQKAVGAMGFTNPTPVQEQAIPAVLNGSDVLGTAQTGTGKTVAYLLPSIQRLINSPAGKSPRMVVLAPTRELAFQITEEARNLARYTSIKMLAVYGGAPIGKQSEQLRKGVDIVVATPGRLIDHMQRRNIRFDQVEIAVLDEADRMLDMGFMPDIAKLVEQMPRERQTLLFSATMPQTILALSYRFLRDPIRIEIATARPPDAIQQQIYPVPKHLKNSLLSALLGSRKVSSALVFTRTKQDADVVTRNLIENGFSVAAMHGDFPQKKRMQAMERFRSGKVQVLVATNVAARGLDIEGISHVINYDVPEEAETYVHRIGRTARVEAEGVAWTLVTPEDESLIDGIEYLLGKNIERAVLENFDYDVPMPSWARPSAKTILKNASRNQSNIDRWKSLTR
ncbi:MAG: DEAD/DEAH box helicase [Anaerolineales bacterium]|nr:DEAD/DEAH box helicase [Anaerolineales bacterium]